MKNRLLIVENERATAFALSEGLAEDGYSIMAVDSSEAALRYLKGRKCDLIITDISLPGMDGVELLRTIHAERRIPSIVITASGSPQALSDARKAGAVKCFSKPFKVDDVRKIVANALAAGSSRRGNGSGSGRSKAVR